MNSSAKFLRARLAGKVQSMHNFFGEAFFPGGVGQDHV